MSKDYCYPAIYYNEKRGRRKYINLYFPDINEAYTFATTEEELWKNAKEVLALSIIGRIEDNEEIPESSNLEDLFLEKNQNKTLIKISI